jgi:hypothetical protein
VQLCQLQVRHYVLVMTVNALWNGIDVSASWILVANFDMMCMSVHKNIFRVRTRSQSNTTQW